MPWRVIVVSSVLALLTTGGARAGEDFHLLMFGSQRIPNDPAYSHTYATFVKRSWAGNVPCPPGARIEAYTISWLPRTLKIRLIAMPEPGANLHLHPTIRWALANDMRVSLWGPYPIRPDLYFRAVSQVALLQSGLVLYKAVDAGYRSDDVSNCIHAVSSLSEGYTLHVASPGWGEMASYWVLEELEPWVLDKRPNAGIAVAVGLSQYPIIYRDWESPRSGTIGGPIYRLFGGERTLQATYGPPLR
jgi:hypothetical protein